MFLTSKTRLYLFITDLYPFHYCFVPPSLSPTPVVHNSWRCGLNGERGSPGELIGSLGIAVALIGT